MTRPRLILLTGVPGSGKTTLGRLLASELRMPFVARDEIRGGLAFSAGVWTDAFDSVPTSGEAVDAFLNVVEGLLKNDVSCVAEYVVRSNRPTDLDRLTASGEVIVVRTVCNGALARMADRHRSERLIANPNVLAASGVSTVEEHTDLAVERMRQVEREMLTEFALPTLVVDTSDRYEPSLEAIIAFVTERHSNDR